MYWWCFVLIVLGVLTAAVLIFWFWLKAHPDKPERWVNTTSLAPPYPVPANAQAKHDSLFIVDLHADSLLWQRDLAVRSDYGQLDLPRMQQGGIDLQVFSAVTKFTLGTLIFNHTHPTRGIDIVSLLVRIHGWPERTYHSLLERALFQAEKLSMLEANSGGKLRIIKTTQDLDDLEAARAAGEDVRGALLSVEGVHALEGDLNNLDKLYQAGFRIFGLAHFFDNQAAGSASGVHHSGLTNFGRDLVSEIMQRKMVLDLTHASANVRQDVLPLYSKPILYSHIGVQSVFSGDKNNISDDEIQQMANSGGLVGVGLHESAIGGSTVQDTVRAIKYVTDLTGVDHAGLGSDFDGSTRTHFDATGLPLLTEALLAEGFTMDEVRKIMGGNALRVLRASL